jgi:SAM-dependent methyltransferase
VWIGRACGRAGRRQYGRPARFKDVLTCAAGVSSGRVTPDERWLAAVWPRVHGELPRTPAEVLEIGCGPLGGFVPRLRASGYSATGIDPEAPDEPGYHRIPFERYDPPSPADAIVACTSLHHVADLGEVLDLMEAALAPGGVLVVVEWARERFDEATVRWCFDRLQEPEDEPGWLHERGAEWRASGQPWEAYCRSWAEGEGLHTGHDIVLQLDARFDRKELTYGPYLFPELAGVTEDDEQSAIDAGRIQATRIQFIGRRHG